MTDFEVHELATQKHYFNVCVPKQDGEAYSPWHVDFEVETQGRGLDPVDFFVTEIRCLSGHMDGGKVSVEPLLAFLKLVEHLKKLGWKL